MVQICHLWCEKAPGHTELARPNRLKQIWPSFTAARNLARPSSTTTPESSHLIDYVSGFSGQWSHFVPVQFQLLESVPDIVDWTRDDIDSIIRAGLG